MATTHESQTLELIRFQVAAESVDQFLRDRVPVDDYLQTLGGFEGSELTQLGETDWLAIVHWTNHDAFLAAQKITATASVISDWIAIADRFVSFETAVVHYVSHTA